MASPVCDEVLIALRQIIQAIDLWSCELVRRVGLTGPQLIVLQEISRLGEVSVGEIARSVSLGQATVTGILERLEKRGLILRRRSESDRRRVLIQMTPACEALLAKAPPLLQESFVDQFSDLQKWEQTMILSALQRLVALMKADAFHVRPVLTSESIELAAGDPLMEKKDGA